MVGGQGGARCGVHSAGEGDENGHRERKRRKKLALIPKINCDLKCWITNITKENYRIFPCIVHTILGPNL